MEGLTKNWGFYLVAAPDVNGVGVRDLQDILDDIAEYHEWVSDLSRLPSGQRAHQNELNGLIASKHLRKVLAARIVVFQLFLQLAIVVDGELQEKHKRIWLLFQLSDQLGPHGGTLHPFVQIIRNCLRHASNDALVTLVERLNDIRNKYLPQSHFIFGLDEAQRAARLYPHSFILSLGDLREAMASGVSKPAGAVTVFHQLGMFDTWPKLKPFLERYVPTSILKSKSGCRLQLRIQEYLLGR